MGMIIFWSVIFSLATAGSIVILGDRNLLSGNFITFQKFLSLIFGWRFISAMVLAFIARYTFMIMNNNILNIPGLAKNSTNITVLVTSISFIFVFAANYWFLGEKLNFQQIIGAILIIAGVATILK